MARPHGTPPVFARAREGVSARAQAGHRDTGALPGVAGRSGVF